MARTLLVALDLDQAQENARQQGRASLSPKSGKSL
jgi:hypothetical protein